MSNSKKWSQYTQQTTFTSADLLGIVRDSTNYTVPITALPAFLGVTGTINIVGGSGTPVLEQPDSTTNNIRTIEDGNGIIATVSALNGVKISHNFTQDASAIQLVDDLATASPTFPSFRPGDGMGISRDGDVLVFTATGALPATKVVAVNDITDFPTASGSVITLEDDTVYVISNNVSSANRYILGNNTTLTGYSVFGPLLEYTGSGTMFTGVDAEYVFINIRLKATLGTVWNFSDTVPGTSKVGINNVNIEACDTIGVFTSLFSLVVNNVVCQSTTSEGILFTGAGWQLISLIDFALITTSATLTAIDLGVSVSESIDITNPFIVAPSGAIGISGAASNANLTATGLGNVIGSAFSGDVTPLSGITVASDVQWIFLANQVIPDTIAESLHSLQGNATTTTIATQSVGVLVAGIWVVEQESLMTGTTAGRSTYNAAKDVKVPVTASVTLNPVSGGTQTVGAMIAVNGTVIANSLRVASASSGAATSITVPWQLILEKGDYVELFVTNESGLTNVLASSAVLRIN